MTFTDIYYEFSTDVACIEHTIRIQATPLKTLAGFSLCIHERKRIFPYNISFFVNVLRKHLPTPREERGGQNLVQTFLLLPIATLSTVEDRTVMVETFAEEFCLLVCLSHKVKQLSLSNSKK